MSSILKALKKLEEEKNTRKPKTLKLPLEAGQHGIFFQKITLKAGLAIFLFISGAAVMYFYLNPDMTSNTPSTTDAFKKEALPRPTNSSLTITSEHVKTRSVKHAARLSPSPDISDPAHESRTTVEIVMPKKKTPPIADHITSKKLIAPARTTPQPVRMSEIPQATVSPRPLLNVDGIAFQEGDDIVAMINGIQATKSSVIEGAKIEAILKDRVLFSFGSDHFEVLLGHSSR